MSTFKKKAEHLNIRPQSSVIDPFDMHIDLHLLMQLATAIGRNKSRGLFEPILVYAGKNK